MEFPIRINKYLADHGHATRRGADALIAAGQVYVNGVPATIGQKIQKTDTVEVRKTSGKRHKYLLYYKPAGILTSAEKDHTAEDLLQYARKKNGITGLFPVGRLDKETEGLIVLTSDGRLTRALNDSDAFAIQEYEVTVDKRVTGTFLNRLGKGVRLDSYMTSPAKVVASPKNERVFTITHSDGRKHHIRRMCAALGYAVLGLKRTKIGPFSLESLTPGSFHELSGKEITALERALNLQ